MHLVATSILSTSLALLIVLSTSPNAQHLMLESSHSVLFIHAVIVDLCLACLLAFLVLCQTHHRWIAQNRSFPYAYAPEWNFGLRSFDFQLLIFEVFHVEKLSRTIHMINLIIEELLWLCIVLGTFGLPGLAVCILMLVVQAFSYRDMVVAGVISSINIVFAVIGYVLSQHTAIKDDVHYTAAAKIALFWVVTARTLSHVLEPLPPGYSKTYGVFDDGFGISGWRVCLTDLPLAIRLFLLGNISDLGAGMPGRLFNPVVYKILSRCGYRSSSLVSVEEVKRQAWTIVDAGWMAHEVTAAMFDWTDSSRLAGLEEVVIDPEKC